MDGAAVSTANWSEVVQKSLQRGADVAGMQEEFRELGVAFEPFTASRAETAAHLRESTREHRLSLADRACLAPAIEQQATVLTADRAWPDLSLGVAVQPLR
ncbi:MAG: PIN domain-containing protein [Gammaproteobacteria bacterium]